MNPWRDRLTHILTWRGSLANRYGLDHVYLHLSLVLVLLFCSLAMLLVSTTAAGYAELRIAAITLPLVWLISLSIRVAAQVLSIGSHDGKLEMVIGPTGNLSHDYENLPGPAMLSYAVAGQSATLLMGLLGLLVLAAMSPSPAHGLSLASIVDFQSGWGTRAWASQVVWVNAFLFALHLMPAAPFDTRALIVGWTRVSRPNLPSSRVHQLLALTDSHLAVAIAGIALTMIAMRLAAMESVLAWYILLFISIYLLTVSQFESYQSQLADDFAQPPSPRSWQQRDPATSLTLHRRQPAVASDYLVLDAFAETPEIVAALDPVDVDEILRKLHREGQDALSAFEKEALLIASRELQARRQPPT